MRCALLSSIVVASFVQSWSDSASVIQHRTGLHPSWKVRHLTALYQSLLIENKQLPAIQPVAMNVKLQTEPNYSNMSAKEDKSLQRFELISRCTDAMGVSVRWWNET